MEQGVGETLREARRERGVELAEIEARTRIRARFLRAIECEEWEVLPGEAYARGFIRTYAGYLGLEGDRLAEQHRREVGADRPGERLLGANPTQPRVAKPPRALPVPPAAAVLLISAALIAVLLVTLPSGEDEAPAPAPSRQAPAPAEPVRNPPPPQRKPGLSLQLTTTGEVWVCLLNAGGRPLVEGQVLDPGAEAGPFRSGSFTVSLGNGEVSMTVNGQQASIPATPSPIGYAIGANGALRALSEGERPTCT